MAGIFRIPFYRCIFPIRQVFIFETSIQDDEILRQTFRTENKNSKKSFIHGANGLDYLIVV
jgi:hypothetical protein